MSYEKSTTHLAKGINRIIELWKDKPVLEALLAMVLEQCQELEQTFNDIYVKRFLAIAEGAQLEVIGNLVGEPRKGREDIEYKLWVTVRIAVNRSYGRFSDLYNILKLIETSAFTTYEYSATFIVEFSEEPTQDQAVLYAVLMQAKAAGVALFLVAGDFDQDDAFIFGTETEMVDATNGFALDDETQGGYLATVI